MLLLFGDYGCSTGIETFTKKNKEQSNDLARSLTLHSFGTTGALLQSRLGFLVYGRILVFAAGGTVDVVRHLVFLSKIHNKFTVKIKQTVIS